MRVLIVDDQYQKKQVFCRILEQIGNNEVICVDSSFDALRNLAGGDHFDLLILDIQIPERNGDDIDPDGGIKLLERIELTSDFLPPSHVIAATSYVESFERYSEHFNKKGWSLLYGCDDENQVKSLLQTISNHTKQQFKQYDIALFSALEQIEFEAIKNLPINWDEVKFQNDSNIYYSGTIEISNGLNKSIIATTCPRMGIAASSCVGTKLILRHSPRYLVMTGIAAGIEGRTNLGDILIADPSWDWGSGKLTVVDGVPKLLSAPHHIPLNRNLRPILRKLSVDRTYLNDIKASFNSRKGSIPDCPLNLRVGPIGSGAVVLEDPSTVELIKGQHRETVGIEMEAYGLMAAAEYSTTDQTVPIIIKSVCDFANTAKNDNFQAYAAYTSAQFFYKLAINHLF